MGTNAMAFTNEQLNEIGEYVKERLPLWSQQLSIVSNDPIVQQKNSLFESELIHQRDLMKEGFNLMRENFKLMEKGFEQVDKRFDQVDKRIDQVDKRIDQVDKRIDQVDKRFERVYSFMKWQTGLGFIVMAGIYIKLFIG